MKTASLTDQLVYKSDKPAVTVLLESNHSKEIRIAMRKGHQMKEHKAPSSIVVEIFEGAIDFGVNGQTLQLKKGDLITLDPNVPHDLHCTQDAIIRLSLSKNDSVERVNNVVA
ncbi:quercetin dioxygenase-like cupin family protein [Gelidibacter sediminis]|uniref:Quercetin dioxygenase-like cupin family protein n=1 Tax=Gelidibacter sediminis TaxID=1608710 RepID=A0A4R7Q0F4_9FLAO|nr:cupin domain-containing protein [Gelidibacter sediminis]TDU40079.1 quercetin dioxygenase-like cupin family protein [Gelidibacter sediminis]